MEGFTETGGIRVGRNYWMSWNASVPFAKLIATEKELTLFGLGKNYSFSKGEKIRLSKYKGLFSVGFQIEHSDPKYPQFLVFWTFKFEDVKRKLEELGYHVN